MKLQTTTYSKARTNLLGIATFAAVVASSTASYAGEPLPLSTSYWKDTSFQKSFNGSYRIEARIEPSVSTAERGLLVELQDLMKNGQRKTALTKLEASKLTTQSAALKFNLGNLQFEEGNTKEAIKAYGEAIALYPSFRRAHRNLAMAMVQEGDLDKALEHLIEAIQLGDSDGATYGLLGYCRLQREEWESALQAYRMAQLTQPGTIDWKAGVAQCLQHLDAHAEAVVLLDEVIRQRPEEPSYALLQASILIELDRPEDAVKTLELPRRLARLDGGGLLLLADLHLRAERPEDAQSLIDEAFADEVKPGMDRILSVIASAMRVKEWQIAAGLVEKAKSGSSTFPRGLKLASARLKIESEEAPQEGAKELEKMLKDDPTDGIVLMALAKYENGRGNTGAAELHFERATAVPETAADAWVEIARLRVGQQRYGAALVATNRALKIRPGGDLQEYKTALTKLVDASE